MGELRRSRVVVADDHEEWRYIIARILQTDYEVIGYAERGDEVIATACALRPDIITLDISMPGQSGMDVLPSLRAALPQSIIVVLSSTVTPLYKEEAFARGANAFVAKDQILSDLLLAVATAQSETDWQKRRA
jgi:DNA-binding NarL/FixJ family response regulator